MSDYTEHLISMAGGDGDQLDAIQRRADDPESIDQPDVPALLALVREQAAKLEAVREVAEEWDSERLHAVLGERDGAERKLLRLVRTQQATIDRVLTLANTRGRCGWSISSDELRRVLRGES